MYQYMNDADLYSHIVKQWQSLYLMINIEIDLDEYELNVFQHDVEEITHIYWSIPMTLYQLMRHDQKMVKLVDTYDYYIILFMLSLLYIKYYSDDRVYYDAIMWQWRIVCHDKKNLINNEFLYKLERKVLNIMDHNMEQWAMGSGEIYEKYYALDTIEKKRKYLDYMLKC